MFTQKELWQMLMESFMYSSIIIVAFFLAIGLPGTYLQGKAYLFAAFSVQSIIFFWMAKSPKNQIIINAIITTGIFLAVMGPIISKIGLAFNLSFYSYYLLVALASIFISIYLRKKRKQSH